MVHWESKEWVDVPESGLGVAMPASSSSLASISFGGNPTSGSLQKKPTESIPFEKESKEKKRNERSSIPHIFRTRPKPSPRPPIRPPLHPKVPPVLVVRRCTQVVPAKGPFVVFPLTRVERPRLVERSDLARSALKIIMHNEPGGLLEDR